MKMINMNSNKILGRSLSSGFLS